MGKKQTPVTNLNPSGMSENSSKSMPPLSDETKESKENLGKGVKSNAEIHLEIPESQEVRFILTTRLRVIPVGTHPSPSLKTLIKINPLTKSRKRLKILIRGMILILRWIMMMM